MTTASLAGRPPPRKLPLPCGEIHVWCADLDRPRSVGERLRALLSADERQRARAFRFDRDRWRFVVGRAALRSILGAYLGVDPARVRFAYDEHGKPRLDGPSADALFFNVSHSDALSVCAVSADTRLGIDIERLRPVVEADRIAARMFSPRESAEYFAAPAAGRTEAFLARWVRSEARIKGTGQGVSAMSPDFDAASWWSIDLTPAPGYVGALVAEGGGRQVRWWRWDDEDGRTS